MHTFRKCNFMVLLLIGMILFVFISHAEADIHSVATASQLQKALDDGIKDIRITSSLSGNFIVPRWVVSISGSKGVVLRPQDITKPVFDAESSTKKNLVRAAEAALVWPLALIHGAVAKSTSDSLTFQNLTFECAEGNRAIDTNSLSKQVIVENVIFRGTKNRTTGIYPSSNTILRNCTFENLTWAVYAVDNSTYHINIVNSSFQNVGQAFTASEASGKVNVVNSKGEELAYWAILHEAGDIKVTIDQASINNAPRAGFAHRYLEKQYFERRAEKAEIFKYIDDYDQRIKSFIDDPFIDIPYTKGVTKRKDYTTTLLHLKNQLQKELKEIDFSDSDLSDAQLHIRRSVTLYYLLVQCLRENDFDWKRGLKHFIPNDETLQDNIVWQSLGNSDQLAILELSTPNIFWGNSDSMRAVFAKIDVSSLDRIFRENLHIFRDWLEILDETRKLMEELSKSVESQFDDIEYAGKLKAVLRKIYDHQIAISRLIRVEFFDIPMQTAFTVSYSKTKEAIKDNKGFFGSLSDRGKDRVIQVAREIAPFYTVAQQLCTLNSTNDLRVELLQEWKTALKKDRDEDMKAYLATDVDIMRETERIEKFYRSWR